MIYFEFDILEYDKNTNEKLICNYIVFMFGL